MATNQGYRKPAEMVAIAFREGVVPANYTPCFAKGVGIRWLLSAGGERWAGLKQFDLKITSEERLGAN